MGRTEHAITALRRLLLTNIDIAQHHGVYQLAGQLRSVQTAPKRTSTTSKVIRDHASCSTGMAAVLRRGLSAKPPPPSALHASNTAAIGPSQAPHLVQRRVSPQPHTAADAVQPPVLPGPTSTSSKASVHLESSREHLRASPPSPQKRRQPGKGVGEV